MFNEQSLQFQEKIMERSGLGDETYLPEGMHVFGSLDMFCTAMSHGQPFVPQHLVSNLSSLPLVYVSNMLPAPQVCLKKLPSVGYVSNLYSDRRINST
jgi:hypothetical protein